MLKLCFTNDRPWLTCIVEPGAQSGATPQAGGQPAATPADVGKPAPAAPGQDPATPPAEDPPAAGKSPNDERVVADLARERKRRQALEQQMSAFTDAIKRLAGEPEADAEGSDVDRLVNRINALESQAEAARLGELRMRIVNETGVPAELAEFLTATDEETLRAQAQKLVAVTAASSGPKRPNPDPAQGAKPQADQLSAIDAQIQAAYEAGDMRTSIALKRQRAALASNR